MHEHKAEVPNSGQEFSERMAGEQAEGGEDTMRKHGAEVPRVRPNWPYPLKWTHFF